MVFLRMRQSPHTVFDNHHRAIDDDAEVERAQAHQVRTDLVVHHPREGEQHRQRNDRRGNQRRADVTQEKEQNYDDEHRAFKKVLLDGRNGLVDQTCPVVYRYDLHTFRHRTVNGSDLFIDRF